MLDYKSHIREREIDIAPRDIDIYFNENSLCPIKLVLPSIKELKEHSKDLKLHFSVKEVAAQDPLGFYSYLNELNDGLVEKYNKYNKSSTYLTRLSNISRALGDYEASEKFIREAISVSDDGYLQHELGDLLIAEEKHNDAESVFLECGLQNDLYANLRLAYLNIIKNNPSNAKKYVEHAVSIEPSNYMARMFLGTINLWEGMWEMAIGNFRVAEEENPSSSPLHVNFAIAYLGIDQPLKAIRSLKKAAFINPTNENAICLLSDVLFLYEKTVKEIDVEDALQYLEKYIGFEAKSEGIWGRLAKTYYHCGQKNTGSKYYALSIEALKNQIKIKPSPYLWNNLAVVYWAIGDKMRAKKFFSQSLSSAIDEQNGYGLPLSNLIALLIDNNEYDEASKIVSSALTDLDLSIIESSIAQRISLQNVICLEALGKRDQAAKKVEDILAKKDLDVDIKMDLLNHLIYYNSAIKPNLESIEKYIPHALDDLDNDGIEQGMTRRVTNNIVFALLNFDKLDEAEDLLSRMSTYIHNDPYATATLGMFHIKKGNLKKGEGLYNEALGMIFDEKIRARFKQRMYFEFGKYYLNSGDVKSATRYLKSASKQKEGFDYINDQIRLLHLH